MITTLAGVIEIGLTGGIGSGKSTVADLLVERGAVLIDADRIVRELQAPDGSVFAGMVERWGEAIVSADGSLDRRRRRQALRWFEQLVDESIRARFFGDARVHDALPGLRAAVADGSLSPAEAARTLLGG